MGLRARLLLAFAYVLVLALVVLGVPLALTVSGRVEAEVKAEAAGEAHLLAASVSGRLGDLAALDRIVADSAAGLGGRVIVVDGEGVLLADSAGPGLRGDRYADRPEIRTALAEGRPAQGIRDSETLDERLVVTAVPVVEAGVRVGAVRVTQSVDEVDSAIRRDLLGLAGIATIALLLGLGIAWFLAGSLARPLGRLAGAARRVATGDLDARADLAGSREQREVAVAFNEMTDRLGRVLAAQREFAANASHQLRTPLTGLRLRLEAASLRAEDPALATELEAAEREVDRLARLLSGLLALASEGDARPRLREPARLDEVVARALERWQHQAAAEGRTLTVDAGEAATVAAPSEALATMVDNLIENALRYAPHGTTVTLANARRGDHGVLAVADEGPGLAEGEAEAVFERFRRGSAAGGTAGTGLGLPIVRMLARRWGGDATIANRPEGGARAELVLPLAAGDLAALPTPNRDLDGA